MNPAENLNDLSPQQPRELAATLRAQIQEQDAVIARHAQELRYRAGACVDAFLPVQRQMVAELGHQRMRQQAGGGDALVDDVRGNGYLGESLTLTAYPLAPDMMFDREHARGVVQLLANWNGPLNSRTRFLP
ncbi:hypothetical protein LMG32289_06715 [Cupriavidus pampae]|uniref:Uncharacterized protein n=1 Tax=Cupriavidus pampae TaxID=659251 RepID=A0ABN7ZS73_9BURK|nr:hypothetical protein LMG32289_06715 [Cupriavidus pampae]